MLSFLTTVSRVEQHMLNNTSVINNNDQTTAVAPLIQRNIKSFKHSSSGSKDIISVDSMSELQLLDADVDAAVLQSIVDGSTDTDTTVSVNESTQSSADMISFNSLNDGTSESGHGRALDVTALIALPDVLADLQVKPSDITKVHEHWIGRGGFAKVYKVNYNHHGTLRTCAAKVTNYSDHL
jgi:hypothetical protein